MPIGLKCKNTFNFDFIDIRSKIFKLLRHILHQLNIK
jgi:hypothetical protein